MCYLVKLAHNNPVQHGRKHGAGSGNPPLTPPRRGTRIKVFGLRLRTAANKHQRRPDAANDFRITITLLRVPLLGGVRGGSVRATSPPRSRRPASPHKRRWLPSRPASPKFLSANPFLNPANHRLDVRLRLMIPKTQQCHSQRFDFALAEVVRRPSVVVNRTIHIHGQLKLLAIEVHNAAAQRTLTIEVVSTHLLAAEPAPEQHFGKRHFPAQLLRARGEIRPIRNDVLLHV